MNSTRRRQDRLKRNQTFSKLSMFVLNYIQMDMEIFRKNTENFHFRLYTFL